MIKYNTINRNFKTFDEFISYHFDGLSAHTLYQSLFNIFPGSFADGVQNCVYATLYEIYTDKNVTDKHISTFNRIHSDILGIDLTEKDILKIIKEESFCLHFGYNAVNFEWLKNNALNWYVKHIISLNTFKIIAAL